MSASAERGAAYLDQRIALAYEAENALLGALLIDATALRSVPDLTAQDFSLEHHRLIFQALLDSREDDGADFVAVAERLQRNGNGHVVEHAAALAQGAGSPQSVARYAALIRGKAERRKLAELGEEIAQRAATDDPEALRSSLIERLTRAAGEKWGEPMDLARLAEAAPEKPRHVVADWLPSGEVTLLAGHGGAGKSAIALHLGACIALGRPWHGLQTEQRPVLYVSAEDGADVLHWRLSRVAAHLGVSLAGLAGKLEIVDASHSDAELMVATRDEPTLTAAYLELRSRVRPGTVLILDGASDLYGASEIVRVHVRRYIRALRRLIDAEGAVLLLAHVDKAAARNGNESDRYSGSTAWHNSVRARWALSPVADSAELALSLAKANHARAGAELRLRWDEAAHLHVADQAPADGGIVGAIRERQEREGILAAMRECAAAGISVPAATMGNRTAYHVLGAQPSFPADLGADSPPIRRRFWGAIERLRAMRAIEESSIARKDRHYVRVLVVVSEEARACGQ